MLHGTGFLLLLKRLVSKRTFEEINQQLEQLGTEFPLFDHPPLCIEQDGAENLEPLGIRAYQLQVMSCHQGKMALGAALIKQGFTPVSSTPEQTLYRNDAGEKLLLRMQSEFGGVLLNLITDSGALLASIHAQKIAPPAPWQAFPSIDVSCMETLQGELAFWWSQYWTPYWSRLNDSERLQYLQLNNVPSAWEAFISPHA
jgi:hypothetical protein